MEFVTYEQDGYVGIITINRPKALNALNSAVLEELDATFKAVDLDTTRCLILTGAGEKSFVAGADIGEMSTLTKAEGEAFGKKADPPERHGSKAAGGRRDLHLLRHGMGL